MRRIGFTLVEMLTVIVVLATIAAIMVPNVASSIKANTKRTYLASVNRLPTKAKELAIRSGTVVSLVIDEDGGFQLEQTPVNEQEPTVLEIIGPIGIITPDRFIIGTSESSASEWESRFFPDGTSERAGIEFDESGNKWHLVIDNQGNGKIASGELPQTQEDRWPAGENVQRS